MGKFLFFGAGKIGKYWIKHCARLGIKPEGIIDNNEMLCNKLCDGIKVYKPYDINKLYFDHIFITCSKDESIYQQLLELGVDKEKIVRRNHFFFNYLLFHSAGIFLSKEKMSNLQSISDEKTILFDLQKGMVLGGIESWTYELANIVKKVGYKGVYLITDEVIPTVKDDTYSAFVLEYKNITDVIDKVVLCVRFISQNLPCTIICNFAGYTFLSSCIVKALYPQHVRLIAVQHSDDNAYYQTYRLWHRYIDKYMVVSSKIENQIQSYGVDKSKICHMNWEIPCSKILDRYWSKSEEYLRLGYAGRVSVAQKRADLLLSVGLKLAERGIDFRLSIAGIGDYTEIMHQKIQEGELKKYINLLGYIDRKDIVHLWRKQDIMISCSEWEGHSISQSEAMAAGAVPVITDVSGARDDVTDGYNGFVVPVGDMDALVDRICYLYHHRDELERMGKRAHDTIYERQKDRNQAAYWDKLLKEVWES